MEAVLVDLVQPVERPPKIEPELDADRLYVLTQAVRDYLMPIARCAQWVLDGKSVDITLAGETIRFTWEARRGRL